MDNELNETTARTVNAELWEPLPGMMKRAVLAVPLLLRNPEGHAGGALP
jgi:hypothetical protein